MRTQVQCSGRGSVPVGVSDLHVHRRHAGAPSATCLCPDCGRRRYLPVTPTVVRQLLVHGALLVDEDGDRETEALTAHHAHELRELLSDDWWGDELHA